jgi:hypothetical protein
MTRRKNDGRKTMIATISLGSRISVQGDVVSRLPCGDVLVRVGARLYRGRRVGPRTESQVVSGETEEERAH